MTVITSTGRSQEAYSTSTLCWYGDCLACNFDTEICPCYHVLFTYMQQCQLNMCACVFTFRALLQSLHVYVGKPGSDMHCPRITQFQSTPAGPTPSIFFAMYLLRHGHDCYVSELACHVQSALLTAQSHVSTYQAEMQPGTAIKVNIC